MNIYFTSNAWEDFTFWLENDKCFAIKIKELIKSI
ncbi:MAG: type II toxin-antitoxin system YoeB family toxin [Psychroflexus sp.]|nr:type II toxin-antitoxin system YoeB family toxin [Psychroflexus sp.]MDR9449435.1 type II toxin-antitoxin system YoeB family toxin [Psychroflexus sp.]